MQHRVRVLKCRRYLLCFEFKTVKPFECLGRPGEMINTELACAFQTLGVRCLNARLFDMPDLPWRAARGLDVGRGVLRVPRRLP